MGEREGNDERFGSDARGDEGPDASMAMSVRGRVQGVGFRHWTKQTAGALGLRGWALNRPDGSVAVHVAGARSALDRFRELLAEGPRAAAVREVREEGPATELPESGFEVRF